MENLPSLNHWYCLTASKHYYVRYVGKQGPKLEFEYWLNNPRSKHFRSVGFWTYSPSEWLEMISLRSIKEFIPQGESVFRKRPRSQILKVTELT